MKRALSLFVSFILVLTQFSCNNKGDTLPDETVPTVQEPDMLPDETVPTVQEPDMLPDETVPTVQEPDTLPDETVPTVQEPDTLPDETVPTVQEPDTLPDETVPTVQESDISTGIQLDESLINVDVTLAASFFEEQTEDEIIAEAQELGYSNCIIHDDGSVTYTMSKKKHAEMLDLMKTEFIEQINGFLEGENKVASFINIQYNDNFSEIDIYVDPEQYTVWDSFYAMAFYITGAFYQTFSGIADSDIDIVVTFIDNTTQEILDTASYQDYIKNISSSEEEDQV